MVIDIRTFCLRFAALIALTGPLSAQAAERLDLQPVYKNHVAIPLPMTALSIPSAAIPQETGSSLPAEAPVLENCASKSVDKKATFFAGGWSRCLGGRMGVAEQRIQTIDYQYDRLNNAAYFMHKDPRHLMRMPISASAGVAVPMGKVVHVGVEYSYTQGAGITPFHFSDLGGPADEQPGHSASLRLDLRLF
ncbi:MAG: hypothetical protein AAGJ09_07530 [Pseudomonadota bacterium]